MDQTLPPVSDGPALPEGMSRFVFQPVDEIHAGLPATHEEATQTPIERVTPFASETLQLTSSPHTTETDHVDTGSHALEIPPSPSPGQNEALHLPLFKFGENGVEQPSDRPVTQADEVPESPTPTRRIGSYSDRLSPAGIAYFRQMLTQYEIFTATSRSEIGETDHLSTFSSMQDLALKNDGLLTWEDVDRLEIALVRVLPEKHLRSRAWSLRSRYFELATSTQTALYLASRPPSWNDATVSAELLRADLETLVSETQRIRVLPPQTDFRREYSSEAAGKWAIGLTIGGCVGFMAAHFVLAPSDAAPIVPLAATLVSGAVGGFLSLQSRLARVVQSRLSQRDQVQAVLEVPSLYLFPVQGALLATLFYFLLIGGYLPGKIFPSSDIAVLATPQGGSRLIVWGFLLGLAVRFLPDITRWIPRKSSS